MIISSYIVDYFASFIEIYMCCIFMGTFLDREKLKEKAYLILGLSFSLAVVVLIVNFFDTFSYLATIIFAVSMLAFHFVYYRKKFLSVLFFVIYMVILSAIDFGIASCSSFITGIDINLIMNNRSIVRIYCTLVSKAILSIVTVFINAITRKNRYIPKKYTIILAVCAISIMLSNFVLLDISESTDLDSVNIFSAIYFVASLLVMIVIFYLISKIAIIYERNQTLVLIEMKSALLEKSLDETEKTFSLWRKSIHDYKNNIMALSALADKNDIDAIKKYLSSEKENLSAKTFYIKTGNEIVDVIINAKESVAEKKGIVFVVDADIPEETGISPVDISTILGNLIDNAIEASSKEDKPKVTVNIKERNKYIIIEVYNTFTGKLDERLLTKKKNRLLHGVGVKSIRSTVEKYSGEFAIEKMENEVCAVAMIPIK